MPLSVLLLEDDRDLRHTLAQALAVEGYDVWPAASLADARARLAAQAARGMPAPALVLLDLGLPDGDGQSLLAELRGRGSTPVIVLSARPGEEPRIRLLDAGADDYLVKPFSIGELLARMRVALRHRGTHLAPARTHYERDGLTVDVRTRQVHLADAELHLTPTEFKLLARLVRNAGQVVTHRQLLADVWGPDCTEQVQYLRLYMGQLRAKIEARPAEPHWLLTETGVGYRLLAPAS